MSGFQRHVAPQAVTPRRVVAMPSSAFSEKFHRRPLGPMEIGLRLIGETDYEKAQSMAADAALQAHPDEHPAEFRVEDFNDHLITNILAQACVQPHDITQHYFAPGPEVLIRESLTDGGIKYLWSRYEQFRIADAPTAPEADDDALRAFAERIGRGFEGVDEVRLTRMRRLVAAAIRELDFESPTSKET